MSEREKRASVVARACSLVIGLSAAGSAWAGTVPFGSVLASDPSGDRVRTDRNVPGVSGVARSVDPTSWSNPPTARPVDPSEEDAPAFSIFGRGGGSGSTGGGLESALGGIDGVNGVDLWGGGGLEDWVGLDGTGGINPIGGPEGGPAAAPTPLAGVAGLALLGGLGFGRRPGR